MKLELNVNSKLFAFFNCYWYSNNMPSANIQFSIAVHMMARLGFTAGEASTSTQIAHSVNASPSFVRRILAKLSKAGLVHATAGKNGCCQLARPATAISLQDIYKAVGPLKLFAIHDYPLEKICPVSCHIRPSMEKVSAKTQRLIESALSDISLQEIIADIKKNK